MKNELLFNMTPGETRIARIDGGMLADLYIERAAKEHLAGNIYKGRVMRVLPGMQSAFVDIGLEKAAFLYVSDVVTDQFEGLEDEEEEGEGGEAADTTKPARKQRRRWRGPMPQIQDLLKEGQEIVVQVAKDPIGTKGARLTSHVSLPGRYVVYMPTIGNVGVSRKIASYDERQRLKKIIDQNKPREGGFIVRTVSEGTEEQRLVRDMSRIKDQWQRVATLKDQAKAPALIHADLGITLRSVRDNFSEDVDRLLVDSPEAYAEIKKFVEDFMPDMAHRVELYESDVPIFDLYGIETEINRALGKKVWLRSGGYLIVERNEALTAIDVNTGRFVGKQDFEETILQTNLEAAQEIAYQLRIRNIGGIIILDFIDMENYPNRKKVFYALKNALRQDRVRTTITQISELGLVEMTRKRTRDSLSHLLCMPCEYCHGRGFVKSPMTVSFELLRELKRQSHRHGGRALVLAVNPHVAKVLYNEQRDTLDTIEQTLGKRLIVESDESLHTEEFSISPKF